MSKIKMNPNYPDNPGLLEGKYMLRQGRELDFMDDPNMFPTKEQLRFKASDIGLQTLGAVGDNLRSYVWGNWSDIKNLSDIHIEKRRLTSDTNPPIFQNRAINLTTSDDPQPFQLTRFTFPSVVDGSDSWPTKVIEGAELYAFDNPNMPTKGIKILKKRNNWSVEYLVNSMDVQTGGEAGSNYLTLEEGLTNPFIEYEWYANSDIANDMIMYFGEDGMGTIYSYQDILSFRRSVRDTIKKHSEEIHIYRSRYTYEQLTDGTVAAIIGITQEQFIHTRYNLQRYEDMKTWYLTYDLPEVNPFRGTVNGVENQLLKDGFVNAPLVQNLQSQYPEFTIGDATTPLEFFGEFNFDYVPSVKYVDELRGLAGQKGSLIFVEETGMRLAFDGENWTEKEYAIMDQFALASDKALSDSKVKALNELALAMKPFTWAVHHIPAYLIMENNEIRTESDRTVLDFNSYNA
jgi:hypothetical protein